METVTLTEKEYSELIEIKKKLDRVLKEKKKITSPKKDGFLGAFGIIKSNFKGGSLNYVSKLRKEWRK